MNDHELQKYCDTHPLCDCNCIACPAFGEYYLSELGYFDEDTDDYEDQE